MSEQVVPMQIVESLFIDFERQLMPIKSAE
jgi:hypothetical protein